MNQDGQKTFASSMALFRYYQQDNVSIIRVVIENGIN